MRPLERVYFRPTPEALPFSVTVLRMERTTDTEKSSWLRVRRRLTVLELVHRRPPPPPPPPKLRSLQFRGLLLPLHVYPHHHAVVL